MHFYNHWSPGCPSWSIYTVGHNLKTPKRKMFKQVYKSGLYFSSFLIPRSLMTCAIFIDFFSSVQSLVQILTTAFGFLSPCTSKTTKEKIVTYHVYTQIQLFGAHKCFVRARVKHYAQSNITPRVFFNPTFVTLRESKAHSDAP